MSLLRIIVALQQRCFSYYVGMSSTMEVKTGDVVVVVVVSDAFIVVVVE